MGVALTTRLAPSGHTALWLAPSLLLIGLGSGAVITPNQTLSLMDVDARMGSTAGGVLQTAQRIGSAIGQAVIGAAFFAALGSAASGGAAGGSGTAHRAAYDRGLSHAVFVTLLFVAAALIFGVVDLTTRGSLAARNASGAGRGYLPAPEGRARVSVPCHGTRRCGRVRAAQCRRCCEGSWTPTSSSTPAPTSSAATSRAGPTLAPVKASEVGELPAVSLVPRTVGLPLGEPWIEVGETLGRCVVEVGDVCVEVGDVCVDVGDVAVELGVLPLPLPPAPCTLTELETVLVFVPSMVMSAELE